MGFDGVCVLTLDPATLLPTGEFVENGLPPAATARMAEIEIGGEDDFNKFTALARAGLPARRLSEATGGDLDRSLRHAEVRRPHGFGDELRAPLVSDSTTWGAITLLREAGGPDFSARRRGNGGRARHLISPRACDAPSFAGRSQSPSPIRTPPGSWSSRQTTRSLRQMRQGKTSWPSCWTAIRPASTSPG